MSLEIRMNNGNLFLLFSGIEPISREDVPFISDIVESEVYPSEIFGERFAIVGTFFTGWLDVSVPIDTSIDP